MSMCFCVCVEVCRKTYRVPCGAQSSFFPSIRMHREMVSLVVDVVSFRVSVFKDAQHAVRGVASVCFLYNEFCFVDLQWFSFLVAPIVVSCCTVMIWLCAGPRCLRTRYLFALPLDLGVSWQHLQRFVFVLFSWRQVWWSNCRRGLFVSRFALREEGVLTPPSC